MRHTPTSLLRGAITWSLIPIRTIALALRIVAWLLDPRGGAPWNTVPIPRTDRRRHK